MFETLPYTIYRGFKTTQTRLKKYSSDLFETLTVPDLNNESRSAFLTMKYTGSSFESIFETTKMSKPKCVLGDLIPRHRKVFNNNHFFRGMVLPSPREREPLEAKYPTASAHTISFLKVKKHIFLMETISDTD